MCTFDNFKSDDDEDDGELFLWYGWPTKVSFPRETIVRDPHHRETPTRREQELDLRRAWVQALLNEVVQ